MREQSKAARKVVVVHSGARDSYQLARALQETGRLERLVTDLYWSPENRLARTLASLLPAATRSQLQARCAQQLPANLVTPRTVAGLVTLALDKLPRAPFAWRRSLMRWNDDLLGKTAGRIATRTQAALLSYSYYGHSAFSEYRGRAPGMLFQLHPHPASVRRILTAELERHPDCASSLLQEWELSLPEDDYGRLIEETRMARRWLVASTFTKSTLVENGIPAAQVHVIPYGVDLKRFRPPQSTPISNGPLRLLFVGRINQRKGIKYLIEALQLLPGKQVELTICGRVVDDLRLFEPLGNRVVIRPSVSSEELVAAYQAADLFVLPSVAEGFAQVLLESLACGLPVLSTTATAAPDLVTEGVDGFVVAPGNARAIAERIGWALDHRRDLRSMRAEARRKAQRFTWKAFRQGVNDVVSLALDEPESQREAAAVPVVEALS